MAHGDFVWADLSTFRLAKTQQFYKDVMGWQFDGYTASSRQGPTAGIYEMPEFFQSIKMPSFWMSYISVDDIHRAVKVAQGLGGKIELGPEPFDGGGQYALIRDPLGAGFTLYEGEMQDGVQAGVSARCGHGLFVSEAEKVREFYETLFGWQFGPSRAGVRPILNSSNRTIAHLHEIPDPAIRGKEQYWGVFFSCNDLAVARSAVIAEGGQVVADMDLPEGRASLLKDSDGAAFFLLDQSAKSSSSVQTPKSIPWRALLGIALVLLIVFADQTWAWAVFLGIWVLTGLRDRQTWMFENVSRASHPAMYWGILALYTVLGVLVLIY